MRGSGVKPEVWTLYVCAKCGDAFRPDARDAFLFDDEENEGGPWCNSRVCLPDTPSMAKVEVVDARWAEVAHDLAEGLRILASVYGHAADVEEALAAYRALAGEASDEVEEERCSCWFHEGTRRGSTEDDPCSVHPDDLVIDDA